MNFEQARLNMVEQQVRTWDVLDQRVLDALAGVPREHYVPDEYRRLAYADTAIPLPGGEVMMTPRVEARLLQALSPKAHERALEIGTGSGYLTALLARLAGHVVSVEIAAALHRTSHDNLLSQGVANITLANGDAARGWPAAAPYDVIAVTGSVPVLEDDYQRQLAPGGRLFVVVGEVPAMEARLVTRTGDDEFACESLFETVLPALHGVAQPVRFTL